MSRTVPRTVALALALGGLVAAVAAGSVTTDFAGAAGEPGAAPAPVLVSASACAPGWIPPPSGHYELEVVNTTRNTIFGIDLVGANQLTVYGEIDMLAPGTEDTMDAVIPPGTYSFECESFSGSTIFSQVVHVHGSPVPDAHPYTPAEGDQIENAILAYRVSLGPYLQRLATDTDKLLAAVESANLALARQLWLPAHLDYARLGAAYDTFGNFNQEINGRPLGLPGGVADPNFTGFLRLEYGLWHGQPASELTKVARLLDQDVHGLVRQFPQLIFPPNNLSLRAHEILENTLQFELTGETDEGSNTNIATAWANVQGTELTIAALTPLLRLYDPSLLASANAGLSQLAAAFLAYRHPDGTWTPLQSLTPSQREDLDSELSGLLEQLSLIPDHLELPIRPPGDS
jgi:iron uptake system EfeUOB component EfeO/EfeM